MLVMFIKIWFNVHHVFYKICDHRVKCLEVMLFSCILEADSAVVIIYLRNTIKHNYCN